MTLSIHLEVSAKKKGQAAAMERSWMKKNVRRNYTRDWSALTIIWLPSHLSKIHLASE